MAAGLVIFAATYVLIAVQRLPFVHLNRPAASLLGAVAMVVFGVLSVDEAYAAIDLDVIVFLLGLMLIVGYLEVGKFLRVGGLAGNLLLIGSVANLIVAERAEAGGYKIGFGEYARVGVPVTLLTLAWGLAVLVIVG